MARPAQIDPDEAVRKALEIIDRDGLASFTLDGLGRELGVKGPSLYHHFSDRAELLAHVAALILREVPDPYTTEDDPHAGWDDKALQMTLGLRRTIHRHPHALPILLEHFPRHLVLGVYERVIAALDAEDVPRHFHMLIFDGLEKLALGSAVPWLSTQAHEPDRPNLFAGAPPGRYAGIDRAVAANDLDGEAMLRTECVAFLEGLKRLIAADAEQP